MWPWLWGRASVLPVTTAFVPIWSCPQWGHRPQRSHCSHHPPPGGRHLNTLLSSTKQHLPPGQTSSFERRHPAVAIVGLSPQQRGFFRLRVVTLRPDRLGRLKRFCFAARHTSTAVTPTGDIAASSRYNN